MSIMEAEELYPFEADLYVKFLKEWMDKQTLEARKLGYHVS